MAIFRAKKLDLSCFINAKVIRDHTKRKVFEANETQRYAGRIARSSSIFCIPETSIQVDSLTVSSRQALRYIIRNMSLPPRMRAEAQLQLSQMHCYTRSTQIKNRCIVGGKGRGVLRDFKMARVCLGSHPRLPGRQCSNHKSDVGGEYITNVSGCDSFVFA
jgi:small subunit ribosomal protein S14